MCEKLHRLSKNTYESGAGENKLTPNYPATNATGVPATGNGRRSFMKCSAPSMTSTSDICGSTAGTANVTATAK